MATFEEHIEAVTQRDITYTSNPSTAQLSEILREGLIHTINKIIQFNPVEITKFLKQSISSQSVTKRGQIYSIVRQHDNAEVLRQCTPINPSLRKEAEDVESLHYRSKYNPGYYELGGKIYTVPPASASNNMLVEHVYYGYPLATTDYNAGDVDSFPVDYEYLLALYGSAMVCNIAASDIQNNMPSKPVAPSDISLPLVPDGIIPPQLSSADILLPTTPIYHRAHIDFEDGIKDVQTELNNEDIEMAKSLVEILDKRIEKSRLDQDNSSKLFNNELEVFKAELERLKMNSDKENQALIEEYKGLVERYQVDIAKYQQEVGAKVARYQAELSKYQFEISQYGANLQELTTKYQWYRENYNSFMSQYNAGIASGPPQQKEEKKEEG